MGLNAVPDVLVPGFCFDRKAVEKAIAQLRAYRDEAAGRLEITKAERINASVLALKALVAGQDNDSEADLDRVNDAVGVEMRRNSPCG